MQCITQLIIDKGADVRIKDHSGSIAYDYLTKYEEIYEWEESEIEEIRKALRRSQ